MRTHQMNTCIVVFSLFLLVSCSTSTSYPKLFVVEKDGLCGYVNEARDTIVPCEYVFSYTDSIVTNLGFMADKKGNILCFDNKGNVLFHVYRYDNGPDYASEGLFRIVDANGLIGFADTLGNIVIPPTYKFAFPFEDGKAKVTNDGYSRVVDTFPDTHSIWVSDKWFYIEKH